MILHIMKHKLFFFLGITLLTLIYSCTKDKAPEITVVDPNNFITAECPDTIKFSAQILPTISNYCFGCHASGNTSIPEIKDYATISSNASKMLERMKATGSALMPQGGPALNDSLIKQFQCWINQGKLNN